MSHRKNSTLHLFKRWLKESKHLFEHQPTATKFEGVFRFKGINEYVYLEVQDFSCFVMIQLPGSDGILDHLTAYSVEPGITANGESFYNKSGENTLHCRKCAGEVDRIFSTMDELIIERLFEPLLKWTLDNFLKGKHLEVRIFPCVIVDIVDADQTKREYGEMTILHTSILATSKR